MKKSCLVIAVWLAAAVAMAAEAEDSLLGVWVKEADGAEKLEFFGHGIGRKAEYFTYSFPAAGQLTLNYGGGISQTYTLSVVDDALDLTDSSQNTAVYHRSDSVSGCAMNLEQLAGAKAVFGVDHPEEESPTLRELVGAYLAAVPGPCPEGGVYLVGAAGQQPTCSVHGELP
jgi:hypothetical protein